MKFYCYIKQECHILKYHINFIEKKTNIKKILINYENIINLEFIPWRDNVIKRTKCSINKEELIKI